MTTISSAAGKAFAEKFVTQFAAGFKENNHAVTLRGLLADKLSWDWSDDTKGSGTPGDITGIFAKSPAASSSPCGLHRSPSPRPNCSGLLLWAQWRSPLGRGCGVFPRCL